MIPIHTVSFSFSLPSKQGFLISAFNLIFLSAESQTPHLTDNNRDVTDSEKLRDTNMEDGKQQETVKINFDYKKVRQLNLILIS